MAIAIWFGQRTLRPLREVLLLAAVAIFCCLNPVWACSGHSVSAEAVQTPLSLASVQPTASEAPCILSGSKSGCDRFHLCCVTPPAVAPAEWSVRLSAHKVARIPETPSVFSTRFFDIPPPPPRS